MSDLFWLSDAQMARLKPFFPKSHDKRVLIGSRQCQVELLWDEEPDHDVGCTWHKDVPFIAERREMPGEQRMQPHPHYSRHGRARYARAWDRQ